MTDSCGEKGKNEAGATYREANWTLLQGVQRLGHGFLETIYQKAFCLQLARNGIEFEEQKSIQVRYMGIGLGEFHADLIVASTVMVEIESCHGFGESARKTAIELFESFADRSGLTSEFRSKASSAAIDIRQ